MKPPMLCLLLVIGLLSVCAGALRGQHSFSDVCFVDRTTGTVVGAAGIILRTTDGGNNWVVQSSGKTYSLKAVHFTDAATGTVVGYEGSLPSFLGIILRTTDGGKNWIGQASGVGCILYGVHFVDANNGTVVGGGTSLGGGSGVILRTTDGGKNWVSQLVDSSIIRLCGVYFTDANNGTAVGECSSGKGVILRTTDGGENWVKQLTGLTRWLNAVWFTDALNGMVVGGGGYWDNAGVILKTTDGGDTWTTSLLDSTTNGISDVCFSDRNFGAAVGNAWFEYNQTGFCRVVILRTTNGGGSWIRQSTGIDCRESSISFFDSTNGTLLPRGPQYPERGEIFRTTDGGISWFTQYTITALDRSAVPPRPAEYSLQQNYPNPFNPSTTIKYELPKSSEVRLRVYDMLGREVTVLVDERRAAGVHEVKFDGSNCASGVYFYRLQAGDFVLSKRFVLLK